MSFTKKDKELIIKIAKRQDQQKADFEKKFKKIEEDFKFLAEDIIKRLGGIKSDLKIPEEKVDPVRVLGKMPLMNDEEAKKNTIDLQFRDGMMPSQKIQIAALETITKTLQTVCLFFGISKIDIKYSEEKK